MRLVLVIAMLGAGCAGGATAPRSSPHPTSHALADGGADGSTDAGPRLATFDEIASRAASEAPLMHETARAEGTTGKRPIGDARATEKDTCFRVLYDATRSVRIALIDDTGAKRGDASTAASGAVPPRGPACAKKGETLHVLAEGDDGTAVRVVVFASP